MHRYVHVGIVFGEAVKTFELGSAPRELVGTA